MNKQRDVSARPETKKTKDMENMGLNTSKLLSEIIRYPVSWSKRNLSIRLASLGLIFWRFPASASAKRSAGSVGDRYWLMPTFLSVFITCLFPIAWVVANA